MGDPKQTEGDIFYIQHMFNETHWYRIVSAKNLYMFKKRQDKNTEKKETGDD